MEKGQILKFSSSFQNSKSGCEKRKFAFIVGGTQEMTALQERNKFPFIFHLRNVFAQE